MGTLIDFLQECQNIPLLNYELPSEIKDQYLVISCLKASDNKQVYLMRRKTDGKKHILKCISSNSREKLEEEFYLHQNLTHQGLIPAISFIKVKEVSFLIREYIDGYTITEKVEMAKEGRLTFQEATEITLQLCSILDYLHTQNPPIIHRDIKPDNIIVDREGKCKLIDFGISRRFQGLSEKEKDTSIMGTELAAPPEQFGFRQTDTRSDIYSLGVLMYYMITGSYNIQEMKDCVRPGAFYNCIAKCTEFSPEDRYKTIKQLDASLKRSNYWKHENLKKRIILLGAFLLGFLICACINILVDIMKGSMEGKSNYDITGNNLQEVVATKDNFIAETEQAKAETDGKEASSDDNLNETSLNESNLKEEDETMAKTLMTEIESMDDNDIYEFRSSLIESAVREALGKAASDPITIGELLKVSELYICGKQVYRNWDEHFVYGVQQYMRGEEYANNGLYNIRGSINSLTDITYMPNLQILALYNQNITDLSPLVNLNFLTDLGLGNNNIQDVTALKDMVRLKRLDLSGNVIENDDLTIISELPYIESVDLGDTKVTSLINIKEMELKYLSVYGNDMRDCVGLEEMLSLETLILHGLNTGVTKIGLQKITALINLKELIIMDSDDFDLSMLSTLGSLKILDLCACRIENLQGLSIPSLENLRIDCIKRLDLSGIENNTSINNLSVRETAITDFSPILRLPMLKYLTCDSLQADLIKEQLGQVPFDVHIQTFF